MTLNINKKMAIAIFCLLVAGSAVATILLNRNQNSAGTGKGESYSVSVEVSNDTFSASLTDTDGKISQLNSSDLEKYISVSFNGPKDIMWLSCPQGTVPSSPYSQTRNTMTFDPEIGASIELIAGENNNLTLTCNR